MAESNSIKHAKSLATEQRDIPGAICYLEQNQSDLDRYGICYLASLYTKVRQPLRAITLLKPLLESGGLLARDPVAHTTYAKALDNAGDSAAAASYLRPLLGEGGLLARNPVAHATYAKALDNAGDSAAAASHLKPLLGEGSLLARNPVAHNTYAKALDNAGDSAAAASYLRPLLGEGGLLARDPVAHATYAKALDNAGDSAAAAVHLKMLLGEGGLLARDPVAHTTYAKALDNAGDSAAAAAHLKPLLRCGSLLAGNRFAFAVAAGALINTHRPTDALSLLQDISVADRHRDHLLSYIEAKANFALGRVGVTLTLMRHVIRHRSEDAFTALYLAVVDDPDEHVAAIKTLLGAHFDYLWDKSRQLRLSIRATRSEERSLFRRNPIWELGATPVNRAALRELGVFPMVREALRNTR
jgi:hypothetical protein